MNHFNVLKGQLARQLTSDVTDITAVELSEDDKAWLRSHGCVLSNPLEDGAITVTFPEGTTKTEILPRTQQSRFAVTLPDGAKLREQSLRNMREGRSLLMIPAPTPNS